MGIPESIGDKRFRGVVRATRPDHVQQFMMKQTLACCYYLLLYGRLLTYVKCYGALFISTVSPMAQSRGRVTLVRALALYGKKSITEERLRLTWGLLISYSGSSRTPDPRAFGDVEENRGVGALDYGSLTGSLNWSGRAVRLGSYSAGCRRSVRQVRKQCA